MTDFFISYARADQKYVRSLCDALEAASRSVWVDWVRVPKASDFRAEIHRGIESCAAFVFVLSPDSVSSQMCADELDHALRHHKRLIPILHRDVANGRSHASIARLDWIISRSTEGTETTVSELISALEMDLEWVHSHTKILARAIEWDARRSTLGRARPLNLLRPRHDRSVLLRGSDLRDAERQILEAAEGKDPQPTALQREFLLHSRRHSDRLQRAIISATCAALVVSVSLLLLALHWARVASRERSAALASLAQREIDRGDVTNAIRLGIDALESTDQPAGRAAAEAALFRALRRRREMFSWKPRVPPTFVAGSARTKVVMIGSADGAAQLVDLGALDAAAGHRSWGTVRAAALDASSTRVAMIDPMGRVTVESTDASPERVAIGADLPPATAVALAPTGSPLLVGHADGSLRIWNLQSPGEPLTIRAHRSPILSVAISSDGKTAATTARDTGLWSVSNGRSKGRLRGHEGTIVSVRFNPVVPEQLVTASVDGTAILWDARRIEVEPGVIDRTDLFRLDTSVPGARQTRVPPEESVAVLRGHRGPVRLAAFAPDGERILTASDDATLRIWRARNGALLETLAGHADGVLGATWLEGGERIVSVGRDGTLRVWNGSVEPNPPVKLSHPGRSIPVWVHFSKDRSHVYTASTPESLYRWETSGQSRETLHSRSFPYVGGRSIVVATTDPEDSVIVVSGCTRSPGLQLRETRQGHELGSFLEEESVCGLSFSADGAAVLARTSGGEVYVLDVNARRAEPLMGLDAPVAAAAFGPTAEQVLLRLQSGRWIILNRQTGGRRTIVDAVGEHTTAGLSPDGRYFATGDESGAAELWSARTGSHLASMSGHKAQVLSVTFSRDSRLLLTTSRDRTARVWKIPSGACSAVLEGHAESVHIGAFHPDGQTVATGALDGSVRIWRIFPETSDLLRAARQALPTQIAVPFTRSAVNRAGLE